VCHRACLRQVLPGPHHRAVWPARHWPRIGNQPRHHPDPRRTGVGGEPTHGWRAPGGASAPGTHQCTRTAMSTAQPAILVIDDEAPMRKYVGMNLKARGYHVLLAANGAEALELVARTRVDLLLLDIGLPGLDGLSVLSAVRREAAVPVLMVSARAREGDKVRALDLGADDYLTKPFGVDELLARVRALLRRADPAHKRSLPAYRSGELEVDFSARRVWLNDVGVSLTR